MLQRIGESSLGRENRPYLLVDISSVTQNLIGKFRCVSANR
jgi:hypothetical protein